MQTKRKQKGYSFNPFEHSFLGGSMEWNPRGAFSAWDQDRKEKRELEVIKGLLAKQKAKEASPEAQNKRLGILEHGEGGEYTDEENAVLAKVFAKNNTDPTGETQGKLAIRNDYKKWSPEVLSLSSKKDESLSYLDELARDESERKRLEDEELYAGMLASEEFDMYDDSPDKQDMLDISDPVDDEYARNELAWNYEQYPSHRTPDNSVDTSMVTKDSKSSVSPGMAKLGIDFISKMMEPPKDDPAPTIRSAGISRGSTPFPSLLKRKPEPKYYMNKGLI